MQINQTAAAEQTSGLRTLEDLQNRSVNNEMDKDAFMKILVMQLSNQNPLEPSSDTEFIAQLAQFSILEQMQNLNTTFSASQSFSLVGKYVYIENEAEGAGAELIFGKVDGVIKQDGIDYLLIGDEKYNAASVVGVINELSEDGSLDGNILQSANLIGKMITAEIDDGEGGVITVTGIVEKITVRDGTLYASIDGQEVKLSNILEIS